ncbi:MAG: DUF1570 domain-containing protein [Pirellulales bacterium]
MAIVSKDYSSYAKYAASQKVKVTPSIVGFYSTKTNRVVMYDMTAGKKDSQGWNANFATVVHDATHQTAYNTSIHNRLSQQPVWIVEGLATMFEAPGVWNSSQFRHQKDRINRERWAYFVQHAKSRRKAGSLESFIASDQHFKINPSAAYAEAWALSFYLMESSPKQYSQYLAQVAARPAGSRYSAQQRVKDFQAAFGQDLKMMEARMLRYILELE